VHISFFIQMRPYAVIIFTVCQQLLNPTYAGNCSLSAQPAISFGPTKHASILQPDILPKISSLGASAIPAQETIEVIENLQTKYEQHLKHLKHVNAMEMVEKRIGELEAKKTQLNQKTGDIGWGLMSMYTILEALKENAGAHESTAFRLFLIALLKQIIDRLDIMETFLKEKQAHDAIQAEASFRQRLESTFDNAYLTKQLAEHEPDSFRKCMEDQIKKHLEEQDAQETFYGSFFDMRPRFYLKYTKMSESKKYKTMKKFLKRHDRDDIMKKLQMKTHCPAVMGVSASSASASASASTKTTLKSTLRSRLPKKKSVRRGIRALLGTSSVIKGVIKHPTSRLSMYFYYGPYLFLLGILYKFVLKVLYQLDEKLLETVKATSHAAKIYHEGFQRGLAKEEVEAMFRQNEEAELETLRKRKNELRLVNAQLEQNEMSTAGIKEVFVNGVLQTSRPLLKQDIERYDNELVLYEYPGNSQLHMDATKFIKVLSEIKQKSEELLKVLNQKTNGIDKIKYLVDDYLAFFKMYEKEKGAFETILQAYRPTFLKDLIERTWPGKWIEGYGYIKNEYSYAKPFPKINDKCFLHMHLEWLDASNTGGIFVKSQILTRLIASSYEKQTYYVKSAILNAMTKGDVTQNQTLIRGRGQTKVNATRVIFESNNTVMYMNSNTKECPSDWHVVIYGTFELQSGPLYCPGLSDPEKPVYFDKNIRTTDTFRQSDILLDKLVSETRESEENTDHQNIGMKLWMQHIVRLICTIYSPECVYVNISTRDDDPDTFFGLNEHLERFENFEFDLTQYFKLVNCCNINKLSNESNELYAVLIAQYRTKLNQIRERKIAYDGESEIIKKLKHEYTLALNDLKYSLSHPDGSLELIKSDECLRDERTLVTDIYSEIKKVSCMKECYDDIHLLMFT
jgi:hypothetical protein